MSGKFMKVKRLIVPTITMVIIASQLMGCAATTQNELVQMLQNGDQIEIEVASPAFAEEEQGTESQILWEQLASLETNEVLRKAWDDTLKITVTETGKNGVLYVDAAGQNENNNTLKVAIHNRAFQKLFESEEGIASLAEGALNNYVDLDAEDQYKAALMGVNGYFNLIPDMEVNYANADSTVTRNEFLAMVFRAESPVTELQSDGVYTNTVGQSDYNIYAQNVAEDSYLDLESKSLNNMTANGSITRAEVIYTLVSRYFADELGALDLKSTDIKFNDAKDGGDIIHSQKEVANPTSQDYWKSYELTYSLANPDNGLPTDLYKALVVAKQVGILETSDTRWDESITRSEAIEFIINALKNDDSIETFNYNQGEISGYEVTEKEETQSTEEVSVNSTHEDIVLGDDEYKGDDPNDVGIPSDTSESTELEGVDLDGDGKISQSEHEIYETVFKAAEEAAKKNGMTTTPDGGSSIPGPTGQQGGIVPGATGNVDGTIEVPQIVPGSGDYTGGGGEVY